MFSWKKFLLTGFIANIIVFLGAYAVFGLLSRSMSGAAISLTLEAATACHEVLLPIRLGERFLPQTNSHSSFIFPLSVVRADGSLFPFIEPVRILPDRSAVLLLSCSFAAGDRERLQILGTLDIKGGLTPINEEWWDGTHGSDGNGIISWETDMSGGEGLTSPFAGNAMLRVRLYAAADAGDCYTNDIIQLHLPETRMITADMFLCYALRYDLPSSMRITVQPLIDKETVILEGTSDQEGRDAGWTTLLDNVAIQRWYYRRIPLESYQGRVITGFTIFINDYPTLSREEREKPIIAFFDAIHVEQGQLPIVALSNPLKEFLHAAYASQSFLLFLCSVLTWNLTALFLSWRDQ